jgi:hypothetical protein
MLMSDIGVWQAVALLVAAAIATVLRFWDFPTNQLVDVDLISGVSTFIAALIGGFFAMWAGGLNPVMWEQFVLVMIAAIGGMGGVRALFGITAPARAKLLAKTKKREEAKTAELEDDE